MRESSKLSAARPELTAEWHPTLNGTLTPETVACGSRQKVWWRCPKGHEWQAAVKARAAGDSCPVCQNRTLKKRINDLASTHPGLAAEWHPTRNAPVLPSDVFAGTVRRYWWKCSKGHEWKAEVASRSNGKGCPFCAGKKVEAGFNDLNTLFPQMAEQWDDEKNFPLTPADVTPYSNKKVWWKCGSGHSWEAAVSSRTANSSQCPYCSGKKVMSGFNDLETLYPTIAMEWHPTKNGRITPSQITAGSHKKVWWKCSLGHEWRAFVFSRTGKRKHGCPVCAGMTGSEYSGNANLPLMRFS